MIYFGPSKSGEVVGLGQTSDSKPTWVYPTEAAKKALSYVKRGDQVEVKVAKDQTGKNTLLFIKKIAGAASNGSSAGRTYVPRKTETGAMNNQLKLNIPAETSIKQTALNVSGQVVRSLTGMFQTVEEALAAQSKAYNHALNLIRNAESVSETGATETVPEEVATEGLEEVVIT